MKARKQWGDTLKVLKEKPFECMIQKNTQWRDLHKDKAINSTNYLFTKIY